jgi:outer membrane usher protein FimD/PapC
VGASGTLIAHQHGVVFSPETGTTMALIEAKDAAGAMLPVRRVPASTATATPFCRICGLTG